MKKEKQNDKIDVQGSIETGMPSLAHSSTKEVSASYRSMQLNEINF